MYITNVSWHACGVLDLATALHSNAKNSVESCQHLKGILGSF